MGIDETIEQLYSAGDDLLFQYDKVVRMGEKPYQANLKALRSLDIKNNRKVGKQAVSQLVDGVDDLILELEKFKDGTEKIEDIAASAIRST